MFKWYDYESMCILRNNYIHIDGIVEELYY